MIIDANQVKAVSILFLPLPHPEIRAYALIVGNHLNLVKYQFVSTLNLND